ncbi:glycosyltransferase [Sulfurovum sp. NBC37-1]|uniref:glycosyltransferase n=1 Tax=Sulfurovum sp. (strain NBC37-1) TaxID=387093 RepID=UPI0001587B29|nr:glycosyltransferase [Sulfurovum sp. NBC37-1]BAF72480.1 capsular polysaccharide biosynthesis protein [Sulfurovum sp. NBC37-1]
MNRKCKKIALITPSLAKGGLERVVVETAQGLEKWYDVTVIVMDTFRTDYPYAGRCLDLEISWEDRRIAVRFYNFLKSIVSLRKLQKKEQFDLMIAHGELTSFPAILSAMSACVPVVHENRLNALKDLQGRATNFLLRLFFKRGSVKKIVTVSEGIGKSLQCGLEIAPSKFKTIYNPFDMETIRSAAQKIPEGYEGIFMPSAKVLITVGRLTHPKAQWYLLRIFAELKQKEETARLLILGIGEMKEELLELCRALNLSAFDGIEEQVPGDTYDVYFLGFQENPYAFIRQSDLFVMTSLWEGFGNTIVEAMVSGTPVISTSCPSGPREIICPDLPEEAIVAKPNEEGSGVLMPTFENRFVGEDEPLSNVEKVWADTIYELLHDEKKREIFSKKGLKRAEDFRRESIVGEWKEMIELVLNVE